jgi:hypothetical protein
MMMAVIVMIPRADNEFPFLMKMAICVPAVAREN